jgi:hypothetical protein
MVRFSLPETATIVATLAWPVIAFFRAVRAYRFAETGAATQSPARHHGPHSGRAGSRYHRRLADHQGDPPRASRALANRTPHLSPRRAADLGWHRLPCRLRDQALDRCEAPAPAWHAASADHGFSGSSSSASSRSGLTVTDAPRPLPAHWCDAGIRGIDSLRAGTVPSREPLRGALRARPRPARRRDGSARRHAGRQLVPSLWRRARR